jgi:hypothetical protein
MDADYEAAFESQYGAAFNGSLSGSPSNYLTDLAGDFMTARSVILGFGVGIAAVRCIFECLTIECLDVWMLEHEYIRRSAIGERRGLGCGVWRQNRQHRLMCLCFVLCMCPCVLCVCLQLMGFAYLLLLQIPGFLTILVRILSIYHLSIYP